MTKQQLSLLSLIRLFFGLCISHFFFFKLVFVGFYHTRKKRDSRSRLFFLCGIVTRGWQFVLSRCFHLGCKEEKRKSPGDGCRSHTRLFLFFFRHFFFFLNFWLKKIAPKKNRTVQQNDPVLYMLQCCFRERYENFFFFLRFFFFFGTFSIFDLFAVGGWTIVNVYHSLGFKAVTQGCLLPLFYLCKLVERKKKEKKKMGGQRPQQPFTCTPHRNDSSCFMIFVSFFKKERIFFFSFRCSQAMLRHPF